MAPRKIVAHCEDVDEETGSVIQGSDKYAQSHAPGSPSREKANSGKSRNKDRMTRPISASPQYGHTDSDDTVHPAIPDKKVRDKRRSEQKAADRAAEKLAERAARDEAAREQGRREERHRLKKEQEKASRREQERLEQEQREREERHQKRERSAAKKSATRPSTKHVNTAPVVHTQKTAQKPDEYRRPRFTEEESSQYGVQQPAQAQGARPRASSRPASYYGQGSRPPTSNKQWHAANNASPFTPAPNPSPFAPSIHAPPSSHASSPFTPAPMPIPIHPSPHVQSPFAPAPGASYTQSPGPWGPGSVPYPMQAPHHPPTPPSNDYFPPTPVASSPRHSNLAQRFQQRPSSAMGHRSMSASTFEYDNYGYHPSPVHAHAHPHGPGPTYEQENIPIGRRPSLKVRDRDRDSDLMPPPPFPRSRTTAPQQAFRPPPQPHPQQRQIMSQGYDSDDFDGEESMYQEIVPHGYQYDDGVVARPRGHRRGSSTYSHRAYQIEPAPAPAPVRSSRRHSYMAGGESGSYSQSKYDSAEAAAMAYQNGVSGGGGVPLTAAALSKAGKKSKSSRSSGSSDSRDESDFLRSATTRTTRSSAIDGDDITIKVTGHAVLRVGNAEIQCQDGGEINISQAARIAGGSDRDTVYSDERRSRMDRPAIRDRSESRTDSYARSQADEFEQFRIPFT
ncbi:uncharacterized protein CLUP02_09989 [Colletotrichum lupini]|uniref:Uncharacterized protein n=1 Tax=Colletotrichum lupini TaxID=145971 RepID=A0A9Q8SVT3_9PEZI|nr:uncharacterized protein CLUP02_09989 [Colletotrichum lupini]UQC84492.1 hypothetical protein CLUP02_09989 [Colletotrichum lupini]